MATLISEPRLSKYLARYNGNGEMALQQYTWNLAASAALWGPIAVMEVVLRNALHGQMAASVGHDTWWESERIHLLEGERTKVSEALSKLATDGNPDPSADDAVAATSLALWAELLTAGLARDPRFSYHQRMWEPRLVLAFPHRGRLGRREIWGLVNDVRKVRNRIAHHSPAWHDDPMTMEIRRIRADEWREVRDLRLEALRDPLASVAFFETYEESKATPDEFWQERAAGAADGSRVSQWVAQLEGRWVGSVVVIAFRPGDTDYYGKDVVDARARLVGVYVEPSSRRLGVVEQLISAAAAWTRDQGFVALGLEVHPDNTRAVNAYLRCGFVDTGERVHSAGTADIVMRLELGTGVNTHD
jgi:ribosomal protein S18 acetylase RimI-like enzyme